MTTQPHFDDPAWVQQNAKDWCYSNPDSPLCVNVPGSFDYDISIVPNALFAGIFGASLIAFIVTWILTRRGTAFNVALILGLLCEILGYVGRIMGWLNKWDGNGFLMQICCLTIGPAFMAAGIYLCLRRIVTAFGEENSRIPAAWYTRFFIPCDVVSLVLQAVGGALASIADDKEGVDLGGNVMLGGLSFQVFTLCIFMIASTDFALRCRSRYASMGSAAFDSSPELVAMRSSKRFLAFLFALGLATICIQVRSCFRVAELSKGWDGPIMAREDLFIGFEGALIVVAVLVLNIAHPAFCGKALLTAGGGMKGVWGFRGSKATKSSHKSFQSDVSEV